VELTRPTYKDVVAARERIRTYLPRTPLGAYSKLNELLGAEVYVKREDVLPTSAFKVRGGINLISSLTDEQRQRGVICSSTGNHGQSIAYACRLFGATCTVVVPENSNPLKVDAMRALGAEVRFYGSVFDESHEQAERLARELGYYFVHSVNEPLLIAGVATAALEVIEEVPELDYYIVPLGGGSGAAGACTVLKALHPATQIIAVQSASAPAAYLSWKRRELSEAPATTIAEGLSTGRAYELGQRIIWDLLDDFVLVEDADLERAVVQYLDCAHVLAELAGAAPLAAGLQIRDRLAGKKVALVLSGANISLEQLRRILSSV
jgi:threonine dehydratase